MCFDLNHECACTSYHSFSHALDDRFHDVALAPCELRSHSVACLCHREAGVRLLPIHFSTQHRAPAPLSFEARMHTERGRGGICITCECCSWAAPYPS